MFFGDSFVRLFGLIENSNVKVRSFKGASAKGIGREGNSNRTMIQQQVKQLKPDRVVLCFGNVDIHMSYYYTKYVKEGPVIDLEAVARALVEFAATLPAKNVHVLGVYPSPLRDEVVLSSLQAYGVIPKETTISDEDISIHVRQGRVHEFNRVLQLECDSHGITFDSTFSEMVDSHTEILKPDFQDVSPYNIHVVWETTILLWLERWPWLQRYTEPGFQQKIQSTWEEYVRTKPWAEGTHAAANIGIGEVFNIVGTET